MYENKERELKLLLSRQKYDEILSSCDFPVCRTQTNVYFDTPDSQVRDAGCALRIRTTKDTRIFTLKKRIDPITLIELERPVDADTIATIRDPQVLSWLTEYHIPVHKLQPVASFTTTRRLLKLDHAELCLDQTTFAHHTDYEIEYEYFEDHDGVRAFNEFLAPFGLRYEKNCSSKIARAMKD
ncbi:CYTH domain-containing protein [Dubosiella muris]|uniref:CYTH domain-containing protein n=1 Tax=Dubosiella muris TaxID=3038133 RepID=A0AC61R7U1_9FIRM|nr:CYTH domain-containing protein [Dubosiella muris]TGY65942.1 CYTH domain-containing protein [Dubosiella muris]